MTSTKTALRTLTPVSIVFSAVEDGELRFKVTDMNNVVLDEAAGLDEIVNYRSMLPVSLVYPIESDVADAGPLNPSTMRWIVDHLKRADTELKALWAEEASTTNTERFNELRGEKNAVGLVRIAQERKKVLLLALHIAMMISLGVTPSTLRDLGAI